MSRRLVSAETRCPVASPPECGRRLIGNSPEEFARVIRDERAKWGEIIKATKISAE